MRLLSSWEKRTEMDTSDCLKNKCFDPEAIIPISRQSTEHFKTGFGRRESLFLPKKAPPAGQLVPTATTFLELSGPSRRAISTALWRLFYRRVLFRGFVAEFAITPANHVATGSRLEPR